MARPDEAPATCTNRESGMCLASQLSSGVSEVSFSESCQVCRLSRDEVERELSTRGKGGSGETDGGKSAEGSSGNATITHGGMRFRCPNCGQVETVALQSTNQNVLCSHCKQTFSLMASELESSSGLQKKRIGHFEILEVLGKGAFGTVWKARDTDLGRIVAMKIPRQERMQESDVARFIEEAKSTAQLQHPRIIGVHEIGRDRDQIYIVSDLIEGPILTEHLKVHRYTIREAVAFCIEIAEGLEHAHERGVVHRDLKPANIGLDRRGNPVIMDFGLARRVSSEVSLTADGAVIGTPAYMSPEQARGDSNAADARSDIYSLGVVLYEMVTGERPFRGNLQMLLSQVQEDDPPSPRRMNQAIPRDLETIILRCLEKDPNRRYQRSVEVASELRRFLAHQPILARPISKQERAWRWMRRNPVVSVLSTGLLVSLVGGLVGTVWMWRNADRERVRAVAIGTASQKQTSRLLLDQGFDRCFSNRPTEGLHWMWQAWKAWPQQAEDREWPVAMQQNLAAWYETTPKLQEAFHVGADVTAIQWSKDGKSVFVGTKDGRWRWRDMEQRAWKNELSDLGEVTEHQSLIETIQVDREGRFLFLGSGQSTTDYSLGAVTRVEIATGEAKVMHRTAIGLSFLLFSPDGKTLAMNGGGEESMLWFLDYEAFLGEGIDLGVQPKARLNQAARRGFFTPDGETLVVLSKTIGHEEGRVYRVRAGGEKADDWKVPDRFGNISPTAMALHPSGERLMVGFPDRICEVRLKDWEVLREMRTEGRVIELDYAPDGASFLMAIIDQKSSWLDAATWMKIDTPMQVGGKMAWDPSGERFAQVEGKDLMIWECPSRVVRRADATQDWKGQFVNSRGKSAWTGGRFGLATEGGNIARIIDMEHGCPWRDPLSHPLAVVDHVAVSPDGKWGATTCRVLDSIDAKLRLWDLESGEPKSDWLPLRNWAGAIAFDPSSRELAVGDYHTFVSVYSLNTLDQPPRQTKTEDIVMALDYSADGKWLAVGLAPDRSGKPKTLLYDLADRNEAEWKAVGSLPADERVSHVRFTADSRYLVSLTTRGTVTISSPGSGQAEHSVGEVARVLTCIAMHPKDPIFVVGTDDGRVMCWDASKNTLLWESHQRFRGVPIQSLQFDDAGNSVWVAFFHGEVLRLDMRDAVPLGPPQLVSGVACTVRDAKKSDEAVALLASGGMAKLVRGGGSEMDWGGFEELLRERTKMLLDVEKQSVRALTGTEVSRRLESHEMLSGDEWEWRLQEASQRGDAYLVGHIYDGMRQKGMEVGGWSSMLALEAKMLLGRSEEGVEIDRELRARFGNSGQRLSWLRHLFQRAVGMKRWEQAEWYCQRVMEERGEDWEVWRDHARVAEALGRAAEAESDEERAMSLGASDAFIISIATKSSHNFEWEKAFQRFQRLAEPGSLTYSELEEYGCAAALSGHEEVYRKVCGLAFERLSKKPPNLGEANTVVFMCRYGWLEPELGKMAIALGQKVVGVWPESNATPRALAMEAVGWVQMRGGEYEAAIATLDASRELIKMELTPNQLARCMAYGKLGQHEELEKLLEQMNYDGFYRSQTDPKAKALINKFREELELMREGKED